MSAAASKRRGKGAKAGGYDPDARDNLIAQIASTLPDDREGLLADAVAGEAAYDAAFCAGDWERAAEIRTRKEAVIWKLNGGSFFASWAEDDSAGYVVSNHCAAAPGQVPTWGQAGEWVMTVSGMRVRIVKSDGTRNGGGDFAMHVVDLDRPFLSDTGYRSCLGAGSGRGGTVEEVAEAVILGLIEEHGRRPVKSPERPWLLQRAAWLVEFLAAEAARTGGGYAVTVDSKSGQLGFAF